MVRTALVVANVVLMLGGARAPQDSWSAVTRVEPGRLIEVDGTGGRFTGVLVVASQSGLTLRETTPKAERRFERADVWSVRTLDQPARRGPAILLGLVGGIALMAGRVGQWEAPPSKAGLYLGFPLIASAVVAGSRTRHGQVIYRRPPPPMWE